MPEHGYGLLSATAGMRFTHRTRQNIMLSSVQRAGKKLCRGTRISATGCGRGSQMEQGWSAEEVERLARITMSLTGKGQLQDKDMNKYLNIRI